MHSFPRTLTFWFDFQTLIPKYFSSVSAASNLQQILFFNALGCSGERSDFVVAKCSFYRENFTGTAHVQRHRSRAINEGKPQDRNEPPLQSGAAHVQRRKRAKNPFDPSRNRSLKVIEGIRYHVLPSSPWQSCSVFRNRQVRFSETGQ